METDPASLDPEERTNKFLALLSASLGLLSLCASLLTICGAGDPGAHHNVTGVNGKSANLLF